MKIEPNSPAFATRIDKEMHVRCECGANMKGHDSLIPSGGLPIRLHIAAMAMQGMSGDGYLGRYAADVMAKQSLALADALIAEYNRTEKEKP